MRSRAIVGLGSNLGDRSAALQTAIRRLWTLGAVVAVSDVFETEAVGPPQGPYLNAAVALETDLEPESLLDALLDIETSLGRVRTERWGPRVIDLDLLFYGDRQVRGPRLTIPHPRVLERPFARVPAAQVGAPIAPGLDPAGVKDWGASEACAIVAEKPGRIDDLQSKRGLAMAVALAVSAAAACAEDNPTNVEEPTVRPNLPPVPTVPPPPHPITLPDGTYTVYGLRKRMEHTMDTDVRVTAYIVAIYEPPECPEGHTCPPPKMPHLWLADDPNEQDATKRLTVVGYAGSQKDIDDAREDARRGRTPAPPEGEGLPPVPVDFESGKHGIFEGRFVRISGAGFLESEGLLDYRNHHLEGSESPEPTKNR